MNRIITDTNHYNKNENLERKFDKIIQKKEQISYSIVNNLFFIIFGFFLFYLVFFVIVKATCHDKRPQVKYKNRNQGVKSCFNRRRTKKIKFNK